MTANLPGIVIEPETSATHSVIWLHGLGADGHDFEAVVPELGLSAEMSVRFVFPHAPMMPVTINGGYVMRAWYDIVSPDLGEHEDVEGIHVSAQYMAELIEHEKQRGIAYENIILAGFSQGGVIALFTGLRFTHRLGGILALSSYLPFAHTSIEEISEANRNTPVFMAHGLNDPVVPNTLGQGSRDLLVNKNHPVEWHDYSMEHSVCAEEIADISAWLQRITGSVS